MGQLLIGLLLADMLLGSVVPAGAQVSVRPYLSQDGT